MTKAEQEARRALKRERNALQRALSLGHIPHLLYDQMPTRWAHARRAREAGRSFEHGAREMRARVADIDRHLNKIPATEEPTNVLD